MNLQNASDTLQRLAMQHQGLVDAAQALQELGGLANAKDELTAQVAQLKTEVEQAKLDHDVAFADLTKAQGEAQAVTDKAKADADAILVDAKQRAQEIVTGAEEQAHLVAAQAGQQAQATIALTTTQLATLQSKADELTAEIAQLEAQKADITYAASLAEDKLVAVQAQLRKMVEA